jgi:hypothetical protein
MPQLQNVYEIKMNARVTESGNLIRKVHNVFHYSVGATTTQPPGVDLVWAQFNGSVVNQMLAVLSVDYFLDNGTVRLMDQHTNPEVVFPSSGVGAVSLPRLPLFNSVIVQLLSGLRGKNYQGRKFVGPIAQIHVTEDQLNAAGQAAYTPVANAMLNTLTVGGLACVPVVVAKSISQLTKDPVNIIGAQVTHTLLNNIVGSLRRRRERLPA